MTTERPQPPTVSIVVPCHDVAAYVDECVESALAQTHSQLQVVLVDDGSTDGTSARVDHWAATDGRVVALHQDNAGLGAARNTGIAAADGDYLCFLDSDDVLPLDAIERMVASAEATGSDIVSGVVTRFDESREWRSNLYGPVFDDSPQRTHLFAEPSLVYDQMACSKLFRRSFWDECALTFPVGVLFEDVRVVMEAHCRAGAVDLLARPTYRWRNRPASITGSRLAPGSVAARFRAVAGVDRYLRDAAPDAVWRRHGEKVYDVEVRLYSRLLATSDDTFADEFLTSAGPVLAALHPMAIAGLNPVMAHLHRSLVAGDRVGAAACAALFSDAAGRPLARAARGAATLIRHDPRGAVRLFGRIAGSKLRPRSAPT